jgi:hypothetical protein
VQKIVTRQAKKVIVETWQPKPLVRSSKRSGPVAQMNLYRIGESSGKERESGSVGRGRHVCDYFVESTSGILDIVHASGLYSQHIGVKVGYKNRQRKKLTSAHHPQNPSLR